MVAMGESRFMIERLTVFLMLVFVLIVLRAVFLDRGICVRVQADPWGGVRMLTSRWLCMVVVLFVVVGVPSAVIKVGLSVNLLIC